MVPSGGVALGDCMDVPVPPHFSPEQMTEAGTLVNAQKSVEAEYLPQQFGGGVLVDILLRCIMGCQVKLTSRCKDQLFERNCCSMVWERSGF